MSERKHHILNAAVMLFCLCVVVVGALKLTKAADLTLADEINLGAAGIFIICCIASYLSLKVDERSGFYEKVADISFLIGILSLFFALTGFASGLF